MANIVDFWEEYAACARNAGVPDVQIQWFQRWVEKFSRHLRGVPLRERSVSDGCSLETLFASHCRSLSRLRLTVCCFYQL
jgi:hypothetical protein